MRYNLSIIFLIGATVAIDDIAFYSFFFALARISKAQSRIEHAY